jgi:hypothetical protein
VAEARLHSRRWSFCPAEARARRSFLLLPLGWWSPIIYLFYGHLAFLPTFIGYPERFVGLKNYPYLLHDDTFREVVRTAWFSPSAR